MRMPKGPLWKKHNVKALKHGSRQTIYTRTFKGTETYKGQYEGNLKSGFGLQHTEKYKYEGEWKEGMRHGEGTYWSKTDDGSLTRKYKGEWAFGKKHVSFLSLFFFLI